MNDLKKEIDVLEFLKENRYLTDDMDIPQLDSTLQKAIKALQLPSEEKLADVVGEHLDYVCTCEASVECSRCIMCETIAKAIREFMVGRLG